MIKKLAWSRKISTFVYVPVQAEVDEYKFIRPGRNIEFVLLECMWVHVKKSALKYWTWELWTMTPELSTGRQAWKIFKIRKTAMCGNAGRYYCNENEQWATRNVWWSTIGIKSCQYCNCSSRYNDQRTDSWPIQDEVTSSLYWCHLASWPLFLPSESISWITS